MLTYINKSRPVIDEPEYLGVSKEPELVYTNFDFKSGIDRKWILIDRNQPEELTTARYTVKISAQQDYRFINILLNDKINQSD